METSRNSTKDLFARIQHCVAQGNFRKAEALREEMMAADSMALSESIASAELIEEAKLGAMDEGHLLLWDELYAGLSPEERITLYYSFVEKTLAVKTVLRRQGRLDNNLFFVEKGHLTAIFTKEKENTLLLQIGRGGFIGEDTFFGMCLATSSIVAQSEVVLKILNKAHMHDWDEKAPGLYVKLESFFRANSRYEEAHERMRQGKSHFECISVQGLVTANILDATMKPSGQHIKAMVGDISRGGGSFSIKSSKKENARALLAKVLQMQFSIGKKGSAVEFTTRGRVVRVEFQLETDYSVHVQFVPPLSKEIFAPLKALAC